jgi:hypothetical protein
MSKSHALADHQTFEMQDLPDDTSHLLVHQDETKTTRTQSYEIAGNDESDAHGRIDRRIEPARRKDAAVVWKGHSHYRLTWEWLSIILCIAFLGML